MKTILLLCWQFFKTGLFAIGGGLATIPFLYEMSNLTGWFTHEDILNMLAISESTPGAIGINMATYCGYTTAGILGGILATLSLCAPSIIIILIIARIMKKFRENRFVDGAFRFLRPASTALIAAAGFNVLLVVFFDVEEITFSVMNALGQVFTHVNWIAVALFAVFLVLMNLKPLKKVHPIFFIAAAAVLGIIFKL